MDLALSFDTTACGTGDEVWRPVLARVPEWRPALGPITVVAPHPDDETLGAGGLIHTCARRGSAITVIVVTDGERARPELEGLATRRTRELQMAMQALAHRSLEKPGFQPVSPISTPIQITRLGLPDSKVFETERELLAKLIELVPRDSTLIAPYEHDGHTDHESTGRACITAARELGVPCVRYPIWAWHRLRPEDLQAEKLGRMPLSAEALEAKQRAIDCYRSQTESREGGAIVPPHVLTYFQRPFEVYFV